jgi:hypothetical protein
MIGVTIGIGAGWAECAACAAERMSAMTGLPCYVIKAPDLRPEAVHPSWLKCVVTEAWPAEDAFLVFDADILPLAPWDPAGLFERLGRPFMAVPEDNTPPVYNECMRYGLPPFDWYINAGLTIFGREHGPIWGDVWKLHPRFGTWLEQTALNYVLKARGTEVVRLPRRFNRLLHGQNHLAPDLAASELFINLHADSLGGHAATLAQLQAQVFPATAPVS